MNASSPTPAPAPTPAPKPADPEPKSVPTDPEKGHERVRNDPPPGKSEHPKQGT